MHAAHTVSRCRAALIESVLNWPYENPFLHAILSSQSHLRLVSLSAVRAGSLLFYHWKKHHSNVRLSSQICIGCSYTTSKRIIGMFSHYHSPVTRTINLEHPSCDEEKAGDAEEPVEQQHIRIGIESIERLTAPDRSGDR